MTLRFLELFAGAGGLSLGLERAGMQCVGHAEIEPHARAILRHQWPDVPLYGDVTTLNGADLMAAHPFDLLSGGSPCQDLSIVGKRRGLAGARSGLFHTQHRLWDESGAPYFLWENVYGALSSNHGADFGVVLSTIVGAAVPVPSDGWESAGVAAGPTAVAAWRVLDLQHFGPPQRWVRVFVVGARTGGVDPSEILDLGESECGHPSPRQQSRQNAARGAADRIGSGGARALNVSGSSPSVDDVMGTLDTDGASSTAIGAQTRGVVMAWDDELNAGSDVNGTLKARAKSGGTSAGVMAFAQNQRGEIRTADVSMTLNTGGGKPGVGYSAVVTFDARGNGDGDVVNTMAGDHQNRVIDYTAIVTEPTVMRQREGKAVGEQRPLAAPGLSLTLATGNDQVVFTGEAIPLDMRQLTRGTKLNDTGMGVGELGDASYTLGAYGPMGVFAPEAMAVRTANTGANGIGVAAVAHTLDGANGQAVVTVTGDVTHALTSGGAHASEDGTGRGTPIVVDKQSAHVESGVVTPTLKTDLAHDMGPVVIASSGQLNASVSDDDTSSLTATNETPYVVNDVAACLTAQFASKLGLENQHINQGAPNFPIHAGRPRRLLPLECERLMGWPDHWTATGITEQGTIYALSDTARYRCIGNGVGSPCAEWIGRNLVALEAAAPPLDGLPDAP